MKHANAFVKLVEGALKHVPEVTADQVKSMQQASEKFVLVDVREDREWQAGHITGAIHIGKGVIERDIESRIPDHGAKVVLYCGGGYRSALAGEAIQKMGYDNVFSMAGGWREWNEKGFPRE